MSSIEPENEKLCPACGQEFQGEKAICDTCADTGEENTLPLLAKLSIIISFIIGLVLILIGLNNN